MNEPRFCENETCEGEMAFTPRDPNNDTPPKWTCPSCGKVEVVDDDPGTKPLF